MRKPKASVADVRSSENCQSHSLSVYRCMHRLLETRRFRLLFLTLETAWEFFTVRNIRIDLFLKKTLNGTPGFTSFEIQLNNKLSMLVGPRYDGR